MWSLLMLRVHYLGHTVEECRYYFDAMASAHFGWAFTVQSRPSRA